MADPQTGAAPSAESRARLRALVIDDEPAIRKTLGLALGSFGVDSDGAADVEAALAQVRLGRYDLAFCDLRIGDRSGMDLLPKLLAANPDLQVVVITAFATFETAVKAMRAGAVNYLPKPFTPAQVREVVAQVQAERERAHTMRDFERALRDAVPEALLDSKAPAMQNAYRTVARAAAADVPVLLRGESGTGKGVLAQALHMQSRRVSAPFVTVNCPTLSDELLASELFGHVKGAFTGAVRDQEGKVEAANKGTLFLDELGEMSRTVQAKLLRFLQEHRYERVGDTVTRQADVRVIAATNRDLEVQVRDGGFREDLLYRLNVIEIALPPLRERREDILDLAAHFLAVFTRGAGRQAMELSAAAREAIENYDWPGNIRELRNEMQRVTVLWPSQVVEPDAFSNRISGAGRHAPEVGALVSLDAIEAEHIRKVLMRADTFEEAAQILGIEPSTLWRKRKRLGL
ncbi:MAG: sigma-54-dependent Fis family transcriptional regulator [Planctomycetes bacterium]|nr:sigma-54-dependent Fis family transcriptional regulator [Planctomycetota bacterium]